MSEIDDLNEELLNERISNQELGKLVDGWKANAEKAEADKSALREAIQDIKEMMPKPCEHFPFHGSVMETIDDALQSQDPPAEGKGEGLTWRPIESAPKGYPALEEPSEWFLARGKPGPKGFDVAVIRRCYGHGFGPWECTGDAYYKADFFTHWMPIPGESLKGREGNDGVPKA